MNSQHSTHLKFSKPQDYSVGLSQLNYCYTIREKRDATITSEIHQLDEVLFTYSVIGASHGVFFRNARDKKAFIGLRLIKKGHEIHRFSHKEVTLQDYSLGIFDLNNSSHYERKKLTEGINLFIEKTPQTKALLPEYNSGKSIDASSGFARYLLDSFFTLQTQLEYCSKGENVLILHHLLSLLRDWIQQNNRIAPNKQMESMVIAASSFIHTYFWDASLSLEETANRCYVSPRTLQKAFQALGLSFSSYVNDIRLTNAAVKLFQTNTEITTIAFQCGFTNSSYFSKRFKEKYHRSPKDYRKEKQALLHSVQAVSFQCPLTACTSISKTVI
ncbi:helix-turn-helix transcriptional regulator [Gracilibacillus timonensis]|uniref:helix-turn-helix transcriptional regulator n=1 Tax=Gracilibacillus timonensis TaxID=1816696 RepID=UPI000825670A|nr:helix-turn-helix transcriptional regulator [Gracilibacillus timonensis]